MGRYYRLRHAWPFQRDYIMREVELLQDKHSWLKSVYILFFRKWLIIWLDKTLIPRRGSCKAPWSCTETAIWTFNQLATIEVHYMEKNPAMFSSKTFISFWLKKERQTWTSEAQIDKKQDWRSCKCWFHMDLKKCPLFSRNYNIFYDNTILNKK